MNNPKFNSLLEKMRKIHDKKNSDYAEDNNPYSNFEFAAYYAQIPVYKVYLVLEAVKTARLHQLHSGKTPKNESINDTYLDKATYVAIEASHLTVVEEKPEDYFSDSLQNLITCKVCGTKYWSDSCWKCKEEKPKDNPKSNFICTQCKHPFHIVNGAGVCQAGVCYVHSCSQF